MASARKHGSAPAARVKAAGTTAGRVKGDRPKTGHRGEGGRLWSRQVTENSDALDLEEGVFTREDPAAVARSLKRSDERSRRRSSDPYRSAMSMLAFYINRAGSNLPDERRRTLESAKDELRKLYRRPPRA